MGISLLRMSVVISLFASTSLWALAQTYGTPLGGFGTGYIVYNARTGDFASSGKVMPPAQQMTRESSSHPSSPSGFHFSVNGSGRSDPTTNNEDAKIPIYTADFGAFNNVTFTLTAFGPYVPGTAHEQLAQSPLAFFNIKAVNNTGSTINNVAVALQFTNTHLGGPSNGTSEGDSAVTWKTGSVDSAYMLVRCSRSGTRSAGAIGNFLTQGVLAGGSGNLIAARCDIPANDSAHFMFVIAWYQYWGGTKTPGGEGHWYETYYSNAKQAAVYGMARFDLVKAGATGIVNRVTASNFPAWYEDRLLNSLYPMIHNSQFARDGRVSFWEGQYPILGTIDQGEHANAFYVFNWPQTQWREVEFWLRQQYTGSADLGQIHHDFNGCTAGSWNDPAHYLYPWDNSTHQDYWYQTDTRSWGCLNCMLLFKAYECMLATGDRTKLNSYWPRIKNTINRTFNQCQSGQHLCNNTIKSSYDNDPATPDYVSTVQLAAWQAAVELARFLGDDSTANRIQNWYDLGRSEFRGRFFTSSFCNDALAAGSSDCERDIAGYSWAKYLSLPAIMDSDIVVTGCNRLWAKYGTQTGRNRLGYWHFYTFDHWGGAASGCGKQDTTLLMQQWDYDFYYAANPGYVYWQDLWTGNNNYRSYMTAPVAWHSMFQFCGYMLDNANNRLWIRPAVPSSMNQVITNAPLINPRGWGTLNYDETRVSTRYQDITVTYDSNVTVRQLVVKNNLPSAATVAPNNFTITNNGSTVSSFTVAMETRGNVFEKIIRVNFSSPLQVGTQGLHVVLNYPATGVADGPVRVVPSVLALSESRISAGRPIHYSVATSGHVMLELMSVNGAKIATVFSGAVSAGAHTAVWNGRSSGGKRIGSGMAALRLTSRAGVISKVVYIGR
jgi:hypothetical protein